MIRRGRAHLFGDDINTDYIISAARKEAVRNIRDAARFLMEDISPGFAQRIRPGDFIVAGRNFGCGSSREAAPAVIKAAGIGGILARSFARIFFRNSVNVGLPVLELDVSGIEDGDELEVNFSAGSVVNVTRGTTLQGPPLPPFMQAILEEGGLVPYFLKYGRLSLDA